MLTTESRKENSMHKVLFWDFDGTLALPNEAYSEALDRALRAYGYVVPFDDIRRCTRVIPWHNTETQYPQVTGESWWETLYGRIRAFTEAWNIPAEVHTPLCHRYREELRAYPYRLFEDALDTLAECCRMGYACHLLSNNHPDLPLVLERMGLTGEFEKQFIGSLYGYDKPCMELYRYAMESTGVRADSEVWMIGDNPHLDIKAAKEAGLGTIWVGHRYAQEVGKLYADVTVDTLSEIPAALEKWLRN